MQKRESMHFIYCSHALNMQRLKKRKKKKAASPHDRPKLEGCCILKVKR